MCLSQFFFAVERLAHVFLFFCVVHFPVATRSSSENRTPCRGCARLRGVLSGHHSGVGAACQISSHVVVQARLRRGRGVRRAVGACALPVRPQDQETSFEAPRANVSEPPSVNGGSMLARKEKHRHVRNTKETKKHTETKDRCVAIWARVL